MSTYVKERQHWEDYTSFDWISYNSKQKVINYIPKLSGDVLEMCSGSGSFTKEISTNHNSYTCIDLSRRLLKSLKQNIHKVNVVQGDAQESCFLEESFDYILIFAGLHHLPDIDKVIRNSYRILKRKGAIILFEPNNKCWYRKPMLLLRWCCSHLAKELHYTEDERFLDPDKISSMMTKVGFIEIDIKYITPRYNHSVLKTIPKILAQLVYIASYPSNFRNFQSFFLLSGKKYK